MAGHPYCNGAIVIRRAIENFSEKKDLLGPLGPLGNFERLSLAPKEDTEM